MAPYRATPYRAIALVLTLLSSLGVPARSASEQRFWFGPQDAVVQRLEHVAYPTDYMQLFAPDAPWSTGAATLSVFKVSAQLVLSGTDAEIRTVFHDMERRHVAMAIEMGTVVRLDACGFGEGYAPQGMADTIGRRLHDLGLHPTYIDADEPVWFTHEVNWGTAAGGKPNCMYPLDVVADRVALSFNAMRAYFPDIQIGETEVIEGERFAPAKTAADYPQFARLVQARIGQKLAFFHADIAWLHQPMVTLRLVRSAMKAQAIPFGAIVGGGLEHKTNDAWVQAGLARLAALDRDPATQLDDVIVQSWQALPTRVLPETLPGSFSFFLLQAESRPHS
jgi:hypothetical protein